MTQKKTTIRKSARDKKREKAAALCMSNQVENEKKKYERLKKLGLA